MSFSTVHGKEAVTTILTKCIFRLQRSIISSHSNRISFAVNQLVWWSTKCVA